MVQYNSEIVGTSATPQCRRRLISTFYMIQRLAELKRAIALHKMEVGNQGNSNRSLISNQLNRLSRLAASMTPFDQRRRENGRGNTCLSMALSGS